MALPSASPRPIAVAHAGGEDALETGADAADRDGIIHDVIRLRLPTVIGAKLGMASSLLLIVPYE